MKQFGSTLILLAIVLGIGGYIYFNERGPAATEGATELLRAQPGQIQTIRLQNDGKVIHLRRDGQEWYVASEEKGKSGTAVLADPKIVQPLVDSLQLVESKNVVDNPGNLKDYSLDKPAKVITVNETKLEFGKQPSFDTASVYARVGDKVALVPNTLADNTTKALSDWRDKSLIRVKAEDVEAFSLKTAQFAADFTKRDAKWSLTAPIVAPADTAGVDAAIINLSTTQSTAWLDEKGQDLAKWGLDKPLATVTIGDSTLKIGKKLAGGYAGQNSLSPAVFQVPETTYTQLNKPLKDWRDKRVADFNVSDVTTVEVTARNTTKSYQKVEDQWQETGGKKDDKVNTAVPDLLYNVSGWSAVDFVEKPAADTTYGFNAPLATLKVTGKEVVSLTLGQKGDKVYVRNGNGTIFVLGPEAATQVKSPLDTLFPPKK